ncbi:copper resistance protein CopC [Actinomadura barringtoniae]|uniref:Copper resistance protein CopC n=2 Tax=Actinomadura barringtoniae TaxID=1427535 RepID=A0A939PHT3_9ACTN|nr:copper resistance protein CopC [Actinomadura barringtoniae]
MRQLAMIGAGTAMIVASVAAPASAHTTLTSANPKSGSTIASPSQIELTYADPVSFPKVVLADSANKQVTVGAAQAVDNKVTAPLSAQLPNGTYTVGWRVVATDGHPVTGSYKFTVEGSDGGSGGSGGSAGSSAAPAPDAQQPPAANSSATAQAGQRSSSGGGSNGWLWIGLIALAVIAIGGGGMVLKRRS